MSDRDDASIMSELLSDYRHIGIVEVTISGEANPCEACWRVRGRLFAISDAPPIPIGGCSRGTCRCDYEPVYPR